MSLALVTGGAGFVGCNAADRLLGDGAAVRVLDDLSRPGVERNLAWLQGRHGDRLQIVVGDVRDPEVVRRAVAGADRVLHFAAQVAVTTSLRDPLADAAINLQGTLNVLDAARTRPRPPPVLFTSTNKVYGSMEDVPLRDDGGRHEPMDAALRQSGVSEARPLAFATPYGCSKGAADQYVRDWARSFGVPTTVFRMSCIYGPHQFGTEDQGWVAHFLIRALRGEPVTLYGTGRQVRDILWVDDLLDALDHVGRDPAAHAGRAYNIGGGPANAVSLTEVLALVERRRGAPVDRVQEPWRPGDQRWYVSDTGAFARATGWRPRVGPAEGVAALLEWLEPAEPPVPQGAAA